MMFVADLKDATGRVTGRRQADRHSPPSQKSPSPSRHLETFAFACLSRPSLGRAFETLENLALSPSRTTMSRVKLAILSFPLPSLVAFCQKKTLVWSPNFGRMSTHLAQACWRVRRIACTSMFTDLRRRRRRRKMNLRNFFQ